MPILAGISGETFGGLGLAIRDPAVERISADCTAPEAVRTLGRMDDLAVEIAGINRIVFQFEVASVRVDAIRILDTGSVTQTSYANQTCYTDPTGIAGFSFQRGAFSDASTPLTHQICAHLVLGASALREDIANHVLAAIVYLPGLM